MGEEPAKAEPERYRAFISYSHGDAKFAHWLHRKLESWRLPDKSRLAPVFIDRAELAAGSDLSAQVREALEQSAALVVVCSPNARASRWVGQEIELFRTLHPDRPVLAALIEGEPDAAFPNALLGTGDSPLEPLAADFRKSHDGQRLGLLKLAAGLTALPLDRLVQRDAQARQRRVMAVTAGALALVLVLSAALVIALRARAEAERQRAEAEGLVEFMLTDLRDKLKGVGRLEIMGAVNERAMEYYAQEDLDRLDDDSLDRRARLLLAMGEDELSMGKYSQALGKFTEAAKIAETLLRREPGDPQRVFQNSQSAYWLGNVAFLRRDKQQARPHWERYRELAIQLNRIEPSRIEWRREYGYSEANLCALALARPVEPRAALKSCDKSVAVAEEIARGTPKELQSQIDLATNLAWKADALAANKDLKGALVLRQRQKALADSLALTFPADLRVSQTRMVAEIGLGRVQVAMGRRQEARATTARALELAQHLARTDPKNFRWRDWQRQIRLTKPK
ncbi:MAG: hypothetical protein C0515_06085 [Novosphingobium sp.]|nr:hypothetical protein [Novosphingobium sp.]MBX9643181.1 toll/interleukin-1 receptor domain-containing protein [Novosphingobium sp.]